MDIATTSGGIIMVLRILMMVMIMIETNARCLGWVGVAALQR